MATPAQLKDDGILIGVGGNLAPHECAMRIMYTFPEVTDWLTKQLPHITSDGYIDGDVTPYQQAVQQINTYIRGDDYENWMLPHLLRPEEHGVWELRTADLRFFGWFHTKCVFILSRVATKSDCNKNGYGPYRNECVQKRDKVDLDEPKFIEGELSDVF